MDVARWVLEFVLRQPEMDGLHRKLLAVLPISDDDLRLKKTVLLRAIECEVADGYVNESVLEILEILEELDRSQGNAILDSMKAAYCMAAVECTVKFLVSGGGKPGGKYLKALNHIWRGRIDRLESYGKSELVSGELKKWWGEVNSVLDDSNTCRKLCGMNTRNDALFSIHCYLEEAWGLMGTSFLEVADGLMNKKKRVVDTECDGGEFDGPDVQNLASLTLLNHGEGSVLSREIWEEYNVHNSKISDVQCLELQPLTAVQLCNSWENGSGDDEVDEANSSPQERTELSQSFDVDIGNQSCRNLEKVPRPNLRERKRTVRTYEVKWLEISMSRYLKFVWYVMSLLLICFYGCRRLMVNDINK